ncbi:S24 family peptidase [Streptococcus suis]|uniref:S24 family peptidase n=3 Tax=Lactobacillales TaxID=186826 RepID=UPI001F2D1F0F|nr:S24 family peptidase [Streptococcus suis]MDW8735427.1 S24 family peptidase [Streptococcus suis]WNN04546.1 S24 family peptidase [Streptococcus suis]
MKYIKNVETLEELKKAYKKLALKLHPDCGGNEEEMKILNNEYDELFSKLKNTHKNKEGETYTKETTETPEQFKVQNYLLLTDENKLAAEDYVEQLLASQSIAENVVSLFSYQVLSEVQLSAGPGESFFDEYETETVYSEDEYSGFDIATWISGNSMEPVYKDGEVALIRATGFDYDGAVYALNWNGALYIKKLYREEDGFRMVSINPDVAEKFIPFEDEIRIVGKVVGHFMPVIGG